MRKYLRNIVAALGLALSTMAVTTLAFAQVIPSTSTSTRRPVPRQFPSQQTHYIRSTLTFNMCVQTANVCTVQLANASLPYNAIVLRVITAVYTAFNSTTSDVITVGTTSANANEIVTATINLQSAVLASATVLTTSMNNTGNTVAQSGRNGGLDVWVKWTAGTGNTATTGLAALIIEYIAPNDGNCTPNIAIGTAPAGC